MIKSRTNHVYREMMREAEQMAPSECGWMHGDKGSQACGRTRTKRPESRSFTSYRLASYFIADSVRDLSYGDAPELDCI
ncbi:hypothetical protein CBS63078_4895 [Aspergillus niger]|nr:hypothetical protein CBS115989_9299 [Aspergillus niger]KAI2844687.1 hypothetical protein CBS11350_4606 [Aspergillus niger]KAI2858351.1 hypothetical protein CBS11232_2602 [Aspergillus niger]KAI2865805.1 hypothetical protein CBS12448_1724 [Aspergillus niger]KAI2877305.1 hypothetical protein CBS115988_4052 [Aspergillus niger]